MPDAVGVAQWLEDDAAVSARLDQRAHYVVVAECPVKEGPRIRTLIVDLGLGRVRERPEQHVRPRALTADDVDRDRVGRAVVGRAPDEATAAHAPAANVVDDNVAKPFLPCAVEMTNNSLPVATRQHPVKIAHGRHSYSDRIFVLR